MPKQAKKAAADSRTISSKQLGGPVANPQPPNWPVFHPLVPTADLSLVPLLADHILTIPRFWTAALCKNYVSFLQTLPLVTTPGKPKRGDAVRVNDRYQIDDTGFAERLWSGTALKSLVEEAVIDGEGLSKDEKAALWGGEVLGLNSNIRIYRYSKGQYFDQHCKLAIPLHHLVSKNRSLTYCLLVKTTTPIP